MSVIGGVERNDKLGENRETERELELGKEYRKKYQVSLLITTQKCTDQCS